MIVIRKAGSKDIETIIEIAHQTWPSTYSDILSTDQINFMVDLMYNGKTLLSQMNNEIHFFLIVDDELPFGFTSYEIMGKECDKPYAKVHKLYVLPSHQGKKGGKLLLDHISKEMVSKNVFSMQLNVNKFNKSVAFYQHYGFYIAKEMILDIGQGYVMDDFVMEKVLQ